MDNSPTEKPASGKRPRRRRAAGVVAPAPILRDTQRQIQELRHRASTSLHHIVNAVDNDPALAINLLVSVNQSLQRTQRNPATTIARAILIFGIARFLEYINNYPTLDQTRDAKIQRAVRAEMQNAFHTARQTVMLGDLLGSTSPDCAFAYGIGRAGLRYCKLLEQRGLEGPTVEHAQRYLPGLNENVESSTDADPRLVVCARLAGKLASATKNHWNDEELVPLYQRIATETDTPLAAVELRVKFTAVDAARRGKHFAIYPAARYLMSPGPRPKIKPVSPDSTKKKNLAADTRASSNVERADKRTSEQPDKQRKQRRAAKRVIGELQELAKSKQGRARAVPYAMKAMTTLLGIREVLFIMRDQQDGLSIRLRQKPGEATISSNSPIDDSRNALIYDALKNNSPIRVTATDLVHSENQLDNQLMRLLGKDTGVIFPLIVKEKTVGALIAYFPNLFDEQADPEQFEFRLFKRFGEGVIEALSGADNH